MQTFIAEHQPQLIATETFAHHQAQLLSAADDPTRTGPRKSGLGQLALQEAINRQALAEPMHPAVLLFEDHKLGNGFHLQQGTLRVSTRVFLLFLQGEGWLEPAVDVERRAVLAARRFSEPRFT